MEWSTPECATWKDVQTMSDVVSNSNLMDNVLFEGRRNDAHIVQMTKPKKVEEVQSVNGKEPMMVEEVESPKRKKS